MSLTMAILKAGVGKIMLRRILEWWVMKTGELMEMAQNHIWWCTDFVICTSGSLSRELVDQKLETAWGSHSCFLNRNLVVLRFSQLDRYVWLLPLGLCHVEC
jgi:hypothetical protein